MRKKRTASITNGQRKILEEWVGSCVRGGKISRNTIAIGLVVLRHLREGCPITRSEVLSKGGEVSGARSGLGRTLESCGLPRTFLKEVTTRQAHQDGQRLFEKMSWGKPLARLTEAEREEVLTELTDALKARAQEWLQRQNLRLNFDRRHTPSAWIRQIVSSAKDRSGGVVEQHLVGAKLQRRFREAPVENFPAHAADQQTDRPGDFTLGNCVFHVTAAPSPAVLQKCAANLGQGHHPVLIVVGDQIAKARALAEVAAIQDEVAIFAIEDFVAMNVLELAADEQKDHLSVLRDIVAVYNERLGQVETDMSLQIEVR